MKAPILLRAAEYIRDHPGRKKRHVLQALDLPEWEWAGLRKVLVESSFAFYLHQPTGYPTGWYSPLNPKQPHPFTPHVVRCAELNLKQLQGIQEAATAGQPHVQRIYLRDFGPQKFEPQ